MIRSSACSVLVALAVLGGIAPAAAQSLEIMIGDGARPVQYRDFGPPGGDFRPRFDERYGRGRDVGRRGPGLGYPGCAPRLALRKAFDIGANRPRIVRENRRFVAVDGFRRGRPLTVIFANDRGCPVLEVRR